VRMGMAELSCSWPGAALFCGLVLRCGFALAEFVRDCLDYVAC
jgi:hypothetical protein